MFQSINKFFSKQSARMADMSNDMDEMFKGLDKEIEAEIKEAEQSFKLSFKIDPSKKAKVTKQWEKNGRKYTLTIEG